MTPQEKALELCQKFGWLGFNWEQTNRTTLHLENAKQCAKIAVDEIKKALTDVTGKTTNGEYWNEVEKEIDKM